MTLSAQLISFSIKGKKLLSNVSLEAKEGAFTALLGPNGAGKSTLLNILAGDLRVSSGEVLVDNIPLVHIDTKEFAKRRGVLSQSIGISLPFSVQEIVMMGRYPHFKDSPRKEDFEACDEVLALTGIEHLCQKPYSQLSGGEAQRVQFARILAQIWGTDWSDKILLLDEPTNNLDPYYQHQLLGIAQSLAKKGCCVLAVLHDLNLASQYADKMVFLDKGKMVAEGSPTEVLTEELLDSVYRLKTKIIQNPETKAPFVLPS